eukprot:2299998-Ditylum_brightwellii.AAC.1
MVAVYKKHRFIVNILLMGPEFDHIADDITAMTIYYNPTSAKEKVPLIEREINVWKGQCWTIKSVLPYK